MSQKQKTYFLVDFLFAVEAIILYYYSVWAEVWMLPSAVDPAALFYYRIIICPISTARMDWFSVRDRQTLGNEWTTPCPHIWKILKNV